MRHLLVLLAAIVCLGPAGAVGAPLDCTAFLTGTWTGIGDVPKPTGAVHTDVLVTHAADGSYRSNNKYQGEDGQMIKEVIEGNWLAEAGRGPNDCTVTLSREYKDDKGVAQFWSLMSTYRRVDDDTMLNMGISLKRVAE
jgi:hypothetical protein